MVYRVDGQATDNDESLSTPSPSHSPSNRLLRDKKTAWSFLCCDFIGITPQGPLNGSALILNLIQVGMIAVNNGLFIKKCNLFSRVHATLYVTMSVGPSVRRSVGPSIGPSVRWSIRPSVGNHFSFLGV